MFRWKVKRYKDSNRYKAYNKRMDILKMKNIKARITVDFVPKTIGYKKYLLYLEFGD